MRKYFTIVAFASFALLVTLLVMWAGSYRTRAAYEFWRADGLWEVVSDKGRVRLDNEPQRRIEFDSSVQQQCVNRQSKRGLLRLEEARQLRDSSPRDSHAYRFAVAKVSEFEELRDQMIEGQANWWKQSLKKKPPLSHSLPYRAPVAASAVLPFAWIVSAAVKSRRRFMKTKKGLCMVCGYDLRASGERCPECGQSNSLAPSPLRPVS